ncbi:MAG: hypothetical protein FJ303_26295 [Planctomycetes bacterium]|nr:hypothetical protein [Planctomycetota bacterium]
MAIPFECDCGRKLNVKDELAGKKIFCPECKETLRVPDAEEEVPEMDTEVYDDDPAPKKSKNSKNSDEGFTEKPTPKATNSYDLSEEEEEPPKRKRRRSDDDDDDIDRSRRRSRRERSEAQSESSSYHGGGAAGWAFNGGVLGGLAAMIIAVVWFVVGLSYDRIFFYPPILFIAGPVGFFRGLLNNE